MIGIGASKSLNALVHEYKERWHEQIQPPEIHDERKMDIDGKTDLPAKEAPENCQTEEPLIIEVETDSDSDAATQPDDTNCTNLNQEQQDLNLAEESLGKNESEEFSDPVIVAEAVISGWDFNAEELETEDQSGFWCERLWSKTKFEGGS